MKNYNNSEDDDASLFPNFFKMILTPRLDLQQLEIPSDFLKRYGNELSNTIQIKIPSGDTWKVKLVVDENNGRSWLKHGWSKFVKFYSILDAYVLMFSYAGDSCFIVHIFDKSASEIDYPYVTSIRSGQAIQKVDNKNTAPTTSSRKERMFQVGRISPWKSWNKKCKYDATPKEIKSVRSYRCENPSFVVKMRPSYVKFCFILNVPSSFFRKYLNTTVKDNYTLQNVNGKTWAVKTNKRQNVKIYKGWKVFAIDNKLNVGDICVFELMKCHQSFKVGIIRTAASPEV